MRHVGVAGPEGIGRFLMPPPVRPAAGHALDLAEAGDSALVAGEEFGEGARARDAEAGASAVSLQALTHEVLRAVVDEEVEVVLGKGCVCGLTLGEAYNNRRSMEKRAGSLIAWACG